MQCFSFIRTMMIFFNTIIFVSMGAVGSLGLLHEWVTHLSRAQAGEQEIAVPRLCPASSLL